MRAWLLAAELTIAGALLGAAAFTASPGADGAESIEQLVAALGRSGATGRVSELARLYHPDDRPVLASSSYMLAQGLAEISKEPKDRADFDAIVARHRLEIRASDGATETGQEAVLRRARAMFRDADVVAFLEDVELFLARYGARKVPPPAEVEPDPELEGLKVSGDAAMARLDGDPVAFARVGGRWYVRLQLPDDATSD